MKLSIIICVYNEANTIEKLVNKVIDQKILNNIEKEILIFDNNSNDGTKEILNKYNEQNNIKIFFNEKNVGKGGSIIKSQKYISGDYVVFQDADLEYDPNNYNFLLKKLINDNLDAVYGSRIKLNKNYHIYILNRIIVQFFSNLINLFYGTKFTDTATNHKLIKSSIFKNLELKSKSFAIDFEISIKLGKLKCKCDEIQIKYFPRKYKDGKKINIIDSLASLYVILANLFSKK